MSDSSLDNLTYEQALERLEAIVERIESGEVGLEDALREYEQGMALARRCNAILARARLRVEELTRQQAGPGAGAGAGGAAPGT